MDGGTRCALIHGEARCSTVSDRTLIRERSWGPAMLRFFDAVDHVGQRIERGSWPADYVREWWKFRSIRPSARATTDATDWTRLQATILFPHEPDGDDAASLECLLSVMSKIRALCFANTHPPLFHAASRHS